MHVIFLLQNLSFSNNYSRDFFPFRNYKVFLCQKCWYYPTLCINHEMEVGKKQVGTMRKQTHAILNTKVLLLYILRITSACECSLSLVSLSGWAIYTKRTIRGRWSLLDKQQSISYLEGKKTGMFFPPMTVYNKQIFADNVWQYSHRKKQRGNSR